MPAARARAFSARARCRTTVSALTGQGSRTPTAASISQCLRSCPFQNRYCSIASSYASSPGTSRDPADAVFGIDVVGRQASPLDQGIPDLGPALADRVRHAVALAALAKGLLLVAEPALGVVIEQSAFGRPLQLDAAAATAPQEQQIGRARRELTEHLELMDDPGSETTLGWRPGREPDAVRRADDDCIEREPRTAQPVHNLSLEGTLGLAHRRLPSPVTYVSPRCNTQGVRPMMYVAVPYILLAVLALMR